jgi:hypothetical protein
MRANVGFDRFEHLFTTAVCIAHGGNETVYIVYDDIEDRNIVVFARDVQNYPLRYTVLATVTPVAMEHAHCR